MATAPSAATISEPVENHPDPASAQLSVNHTSSLPHDVTSQEEASSSQAQTDDTQAPQPAAAAHTTVHITSEAAEHQSASAPARESVAQPAPRPRAEVRPADASVTEEAELVCGNGNDDSHMKQYAKGILSRLKVELSEKFDAAKDTRWLLKKLGDNGWWLRAPHARSVMEKMKLTPENAKKLSDPFYIRDIFVYMPDVRWPEEKPRCPRCLSRHTGVHDYQLHHPSRQCTGLCRKLLCRKNVVVYKSIAAIKRLEKVVVYKSIVTIKLLFLSRSLGESSCLHSRSLGESCCL